MFATGTVSFFDTTAALPNYGAGRPRLRDTDERFCGSYRMFRPDGSLLPHHQSPMADVLRTAVSVREQEVHIERPDGSRGIALVIEAIKDSHGYRLTRRSRFESDGTQDWSRVYSHLMSMAELRWRRGAGSS